MNISNLTLQNITCFENQTFEFGKLNVIYGPDGSGKSTIHDGLELLITGKCSGRNKDHLQRVSTTTGMIGSDVSIKGNSRRLEKQFSAGSKTTQGISQTKLLAELGVTKPALELLADVWQMLRKSEREMSSSIQRALTTNYTVEDIMAMLPEHIAVPEQAMACQQLLHTLIKRSSSDTVKTAITKVEKSIKDDDKRIAEINTELTTLEGKLEHVKNVNLDMVKKAREKISITDTIKNRKAELQIIQDVLENSLAKELEETKAKVPTDPEKDITTISARLMTIEKEVSEALDESSRIQSDVTAEQTLPCKWFGICMLDDTHRLQIIKKQKDDNASKKAQLRLKIDTLSEEREKLKQEVSAAKIHNANIESRKKDLQAIEHKIAAEKAQAERIKDIIKELEASIPADVDDQIGDALFTLAEEAESMRARKSELESERDQCNARASIHVVLQGALHSIADSLTTTKTETFIEQMKEDLQLLFGEDVEYSEEKGFTIGNVPVSYLSMSQKQRVGIAMQHSTAKTTGVNIMLVDDVNIITQYDRVGKLLKDAVELDDITVFVFSSIEGIADSIGIEPTVIRLGG